MGGSSFDIPSYWVRRTEYRGGVAKKTEKARFFELKSRFPYDVCNETGPTTLY
jgi:hypothetical protein